MNLIQKYRNWKSQKIQEKIENYKNSIKIDEKYYFIVTDKFHNNKGNDFRQDLYLEEMKKVKTDLLIKESKKQKLEKKLGVAA
jgi:hypothetical protein